MQKKQTWIWRPDQQRVFNRAKAQLTKAPLLVHYSTKEELVLSCDASSYGVGAVLSHRLTDGSEHPVAYVSRSMSPTERRYSQLDREVLAIIFGIVKSRQYLLGRHFTILSDHQPLMHLFSPSSAVPQMASQRWALILGAHDYDISYRPGEEHGNTDGLSRLPLPEPPTNVPLPGETILVLDCLQHSPVTAMKIKTWTDRDQVLSQIHNWE